MKRRAVITLLWAVGLFAVVCYYIPLFRLQEVQVFGRTGTSEDQIKALLDVEPGSNLLRLDLQGWANRIVALPEIQEARTYVTLTGKAVAHVEAAQPIGLVDTRPVAGVTAAGVLLPLADHAPSAALPLITGVGGTPDYYSDVPRRGVLTALAFLRQWRRQPEPRARRLVEVRLRPSGEVHVYLWPDRLLVNVGRGRWGERTETLWSVLKRLPLSDETLDLRFSGQVIGSL
jgi:hypothetical protein